MSVENNYKMAWSRWITIFKYKLILLPTLLGLLSGAMFSCRLPTEYTAEAVIRVGGYQRETKQDSIYILIESASEIIRRLPTPNFLSGAGPACETGEIRNMILREDLGGQGLLYAREILGTTNLITLELTGSAPKVLEFVISCLVSQIVSEHLKLITPKIEMATKLIRSAESQLLSLKEHENSSRQEPLKKLITPKNFQDSQRLEAFSLAIFQMEKTMFDVSSEITFPD